MKRLIWKEWREKRIWTLVFFAFVAAPLLLLQDGLSFGGQLITTSPFVALLLIPGLLLGLNTFSKETGYECQDFLFSRAIGWKNVLAAKVLVDCMTMLAGILAGAILYRALLPSDYAPFVSVSRIMIGAGIAFAVAAVGYLPGFGASIVLPGVFGGGLVLCLLVMAVLGEFPIAYLTDTSPIPLAVAWLIAAIVGTVLIARRGLGLSAKERAKRFLLYTVVISTIMLVWTIPVYNSVSKPVMKAAERFAQANYNVRTDISPDGRFLTKEISQDIGGTWQEKGYLIRRSDGQTVEIPNFKYGYSSGWYAPDTLVGFQQNNSDKQSSIITYRMDDSGKIILRESAHLPSGWMSRMLSPNGRYAALTATIGEELPGFVARPGPVDETRVKRHTWFSIYDLETLKPIFTQVSPVKGISFRWDSDSVLRTVESRTEGHVRRSEERKLTVAPGAKIKEELIRTTITER